MITFFIGILDVYKRQEALGDDHIIENILTHDSNESEAEEEMQQESCLPPPALQNMLWTQGSWYQHISDATTATLYWSNT